MMRPHAIRQRPLPEGESRLPPDLHPVIQRVLLARGVTGPEAMQLEMADMLSPQGLSGIGAAASLLADAITGERSILVVGDFDADGATGTAVAVLALRAMGCKRVTFRVPNRFEFGYGLTVPLVNTLSAGPPDLLVTVDSGIGCVKGVARARELGCQVIITDHHLPGEVIPAADAIVNPNCAGDPFPSKAMAGVGVVFYLMGVLRQVLRQKNWFSQRRPEPRLADLLDLVALGTVADLVPLDHNNRVLVRQGVGLIQRGLARPGMMALLRAGRRDYRYASASDLGFAVAPRLNAAGRLEDMSIGIRCLLSDDREEADRLAAQLDELNRQRRDMQEQMQIEAMQQVRELIATLQREQDLPAALCLHDENWHQGIVGLLASKVKDAVYRPVVAFAPESPGSDLLKGSARSVKGLHIRDILALVAVRAPDVMRAFGGHAMAAGLSLHRSDLALFRQHLEQAVATELEGANPEAELLTDGVLRPEEIDLDLALRIEASGPWGQRFPEPLFDGRFEVVGQSVVGGAHLRLQVRALGGRKILQAIAFNHLPENSPSAMPVRLLYRLGVNRWRDNETCQLVVERIVRED